MQTTIEAEMQQFEQMYQEHLDRIYRFVYRHVRNREAAEDLTSQIFLKAVRSMELEQSAHSSSAWLFRVAHTTIADYWRAHYRRATTYSLEELLEAGWKGPEAEEGSTLSSNVSADRVQCILQLLPPRYGEVLTYRFLLNLSVRETAASMGLTETNVKVMQFRALKRAANLDTITN
ncbi:MAG TPA: RNA polymerase sigma factor [Ktedonobacteraceae bacterium]|jgi:RNA polymerase sigma-70 factor (ECF subfamily)|nr:RNA polymerase sigma factor [Ktedonobacteraceae bacterium]